MSYDEGIRVLGKHSFNDFGLVLNNRQIGYPKKRSIRKTVPYMNGFYDYTELYGASSWDEREISYTFDVIGFTVEEMEYERNEVVNWLCNVHNEFIYDDALPDYHFVGSFDSISSSEDGEQATLTFTFVCYPFMIRNAPTARELTESEVIVIENKGQPVRLKVASTASCTVVKDGVRYAIPANISGHDVLTLDNGTNNLEVEVTGGEVVLSWVEEVL